jgi:hypothetical protein
MEYPVARDKQLTIMLGHQQTIEKRFGNEQSNAVSGDL